MINPETIDAINRTGLPLKPYASKVMTASLFQPGYDSIIIMQLNPQEDGNIPIATYKLNGKVTVYNNYLKNGPDQRHISTSTVREYERGSNVWKNLLKTNAKNAEHIFIPAV